MKVVCVVGLVGILLSCVWGSIDSGAFASDKPSVEGPKALPSLNVDIIIKGPESCMSGQDITYTVNIVNKTSQALEDVVIRAQIPAGLWFRGRDEGTPLKWNLGKMDPGDQRSVSFMVFPMRPGTYTLLAQTYVANQQVRETTFNTKVNPVPQGATDVRIIFSLQADYPLARIFPDAVFMDGKPIKEGDTIKTGPHQFEVNKRGYKRWAQSVSVGEGAGDSVFRLGGIIEAKERIVLFNIVEKASSKLILPDQVTLEPTGAPGKGRTIKDRDSVKPGNYKVVIEKKGFKILSHDISIPADEAPFELKGEMFLESNAKPPEPDQDRIVVVLWDVGGGNFLAPTAKILVDVFGTNAAEIRLFSVDSDGAMTELQSFACGDGSRINFNTKYNRGQTQSLEIRLYDGKGNLLAFSKRKVN
jgi:uncharacterized repeat protein (TIGR01451 family)